MKLYTRILGVISVLMLVFMMTGISNANSVNHQAYIAESYSFESDSVNFIPTGLIESEGMVVSLDKKSMKQLNDKFTLYSKIRHNLPFNKKISASRHSNCNKQHALKVSNVIKLRPG